jgi:hypothetical protein
MGAARLRKGGRGTDKSSVVVPSQEKSMQRLATWVIVGLVVALGVAATLTALVEKSDNKAAVSAERSSTPTVPLPRCRADQLALTTEVLGGSPVVVLRHLSGPSCDVGTLRVLTSIRDQRGERAPLGAARDPFTGEISPGVDFITAIIYQAWCDQKGPLVATIRAGELSATRRLAIHGCLNRGDSRPR